MRRRPITDAWIAPAFTRRLLGLGSVLACYAVAAPAVAQDSIDITADMGMKCALLQDAARPLAVGDLARPGDGRLVAEFVGTAVHDVGDYWCNAPATVTLEASPLVHDAVGPTYVGDPSFVSRVDYHVRLVWGSVDLTVVTGAGPAQAAAGAANRGQLILSVSAPSSTGRPIAGDYGSTITLTITPGGI